MPIIHCIFAAVKAGMNHSFVFGLRTSGDGFYADGSFLQHSYYPYTGGYGTSFIETIGPLMYVLAESPWALRYDNGEEQSILNQVFLAYEPLIYTGLMMDMVRAREISVISSQDIYTGTRAIRAIMNLGPAMEGAQKARCDSMINGL